MKKTVISVFTVVMLLAFSTVAFSQLAIDLRPFEWNKYSEISYQNFIVNYSWDKYTLGVGHQKVPTIGYQEATIGGGYRLPSLKSFEELDIYSVYYLIFSEIKGEDELVKYQSFVPGFLSIDAKGDNQGSAWMVLYMPLTSKGKYQLLIDPFEYQHEVVERLFGSKCSLYIGVSGLLSWLEGPKTVFDFKVGPKAAVVYSCGSTEFRAAWYNSGNPNFEATGDWHYQIRQQFVIPLPKK